MISIDADRYDESGSPVSPPSGEQHSGQVRMAYRLARSFVDRLLHVHGIGWHYFDGTRWAEDDRGYARRAVLEILRDALSESLGGDRQLRADVSRCESDPGITGVLGIAASLVEFAATVADLDADPWALNTASGTLDLRTGALRPHDPRDRITKATTAAYRPDSGRGVWDAFLASVLPDEDERKYLQRVIGQALYGSVTEHLFPILIGTGANGKSTLCAAIHHALGDYAIAIDPSLLMARRDGRSPGPELMQLLGARIVIGSETDQGRQLDEPTMKRLTGGDAITARRLYREPVTWAPSHQLLYVTNHLPAVKGNDPATWRRVRAIPFDVTIRPEDRDPELPHKLTAHADAVLSWAVEGYRDWRTHGMREPASVLCATEAYQADSDAVRRFIAESCHVNPNAADTTRKLFSAWQAWAASEGADPLTEKAFAKELDRLGYPSRKSRGLMVRAGLMALDGDEERRW